MDPQPEIATCRKKRDQLQLENQLAAATIANCNAPTECQKIELREDSINDKEKFMNHEGDLLNKQIKHVSENLDSTSENLEHLDIRTQLEIELAKKTTDLQFSNSASARFNVTLQQLRTQVQKMRQDCEQTNKLMYHYQERQSCQTKHCELYTETIKDRTAEKSELKNANTDMKTYIHDTNNLNEELETKQSNLEVSHQTANMLLQASNEDNFQDATMLAALEEIEKKRSLPYNYQQEERNRNNEQLIVKHEATIVYLQEQLSSVQTNCSIAEFNCEELRKQCFKHVDEKSRLIAVCRQTRSLEILKGELETIKESAKNDEHSHDARETSARIQKTEASFKKMIYEITEEYSLHSEDDRARKICMLIVDLIHKLQEPLLTPLEWENTIAEANMKIQELQRFLLNNVLAKYIFSQEKYYTA